jgi:hypothetical protein
MQIIWGDHNILRKNVPFINCIAYLSCNWLKMCKAGNISTPCVQQVVWTSASHQSKFWINYSFLNQYISGTQQIIGKFISVLSLRNFDLHVNRFLYENIFVWEKICNLPHTTGSALQLYYAYVHNASKLFLVLFKNIHLILYF